MLDSHAGPGATRRVLYGRRAAVHARTGCSVQTVLIARALRALSGGRQISNLGFAVDPQVK